MPDLLTALSKHLKHRDAETLDLKPKKENLDAGFTTSFQPNSIGAITQQRFWYRLAQFLKENDIVVAETGTCLFGAAVIPLPKGTTFVGQVLWGSIGYSVGSVLGCAIASRVLRPNLAPGKVALSEAQGEGSPPDCPPGVKRTIAAPQRRSILLVGDGSFQMTAQELSTMLRYNLKPIIILINNDGYTIERDIHGATMPYNDIQRWNYHKLHEVFANNGWGTKVSTESEFESALQQAEQYRDKLAFIEVVMEKMDSPENLLKMLEK